MAKFLDLSVNGIALGAVSGGTNTTQALLSTTGSNVLQLSGANTSTLCRLSGVDQPAADTDAANKLYVQSYVLGQIRGLQLKQSVQLASKTPVALVAHFPTAKQKPLHRLGCSEAQRSNEPITSSMKRTPSLAPWTFLPRFRLQFRASASLWLRVSRCPSVVSFYGPNGTHRPLRLSSPGTLKHRNICLKSGSLRKLPCENSEAASHVDDHLQGTP